MKHFSPARPVSAFAESAPFLPRAGSSLRAAFSRLGRISFTEKRSFARHAAGVRYAAGARCAAGVLAALGLTAGPAAAQGMQTAQEVPSAPSASASVRAGALVITEPWSRATPGGARVGGGYLRITNTGNAPDRLSGGTFALAGRVEVHQMSMSGDVMRMAPVTGGLPIAPGETVELKPGGFHLMFMDLKEPLKEGRAVAGTLVFEKAGPVAVSYTVRGIGGAGGPAARIPMLQEKSR